MKLCMSQSTLWNMRLFLFSMNLEKNSKIIPRFFFFWKNKQTKIKQKGNEETGLASLSKWRYGLASRSHPLPPIFFFFFKSLNSAFWNLRMKMLNFSYGDCEKFMLWKSMTCWWLFFGSLSCNTLSTGQGARAQGPQGAPEIRKGTSISPRWHFPSLVVAR